MTRVLFTGYAPSHYLCFRPIHERLAALPDVEVFVSGGWRTQTTHGFRYDGAGMYRPLGVPEDRILPAESLGGQRFDLVLSANKRQVAPRETYATSVLIFQGVSFRNRGVREENLAYDRFFLIGPYMRRAFAGAGLLGADDPRGVPIGFPKTDALLDGSLDRPSLLRRYDLDGSRPVVLYAPTGQAHNSLETMGEDVIRGLTRADRFDLLVKPHDHPKNDVDWPGRLSALEGPHTRLVRDFDVTPLLFLADVLLTDASSVANEFTLLDRPIVFLDVPELIAAAKSEGARVDLGTWGRRAGEVVGSAAEVADAVTRALGDPGRFSPVRKAIARDLFYNPGRATETATGWMRRQLLGA